MVNICLAFSLAGCAVHYYDTETKAEHVWGIGHMVMKAQFSDDSRQAIVRGTDLVGIGAGQADEGSFFSIGWDRRRRIEIVNDNTELGLVWPSGNFLNMRIGSYIPEFPNKHDGKTEEQRRAQ